MAGALSVASIAWACTPQNGNTNVTSPNCSAQNTCKVQAGTANGFVVYGSNVQTNPGSGFGNTYNLVFSFQPWCHYDTRNINLADTSTGYVGRTTFSPSATTLKMPATGVDHNGDSSPDVRANVPTVAKNYYDVCFNNGTGDMSSNSTAPVTVQIT